MIMSQAILYLYGSRWQKRTCPYPCVFLLMFAFATLYLFDASRFAEFPSPTTPSESFVSLTRNGATKQGSPSSSTKPAINPHPNSTSDVVDSRREEPRAALQLRHKGLHEDYNPAWASRFPLDWPKECRHTSKFCNVDDECCGSSVCDKGLGEVESNNGKCTTWGWLLHHDPHARKQQRKIDDEENLGM